MADDLSVDSSNNYSILGEFRALLKKKTSFLGVVSISERYPLVNVYIAMERSTMLLMGKSTISMAISNSYVSHYQRVHPIKITILLVKPH